MSFPKLRLIVQRETADRIEDLVAFDVTAEQVARVVPGLLAETLGAELVAVTSVTPDARPADDAEPDGDDKPKRKRRTKAEIAADEAAARLDAVQQAAVPAASVEQVSPESAPAAVAEPAQVAVPAPPAEPASDATKPPYDPFA